MRLNFKDILYRHRHLILARIRDNRADQEDFKNLDQLSYLLQCLKEYKAQDAQLTTITNRLGRRL